MNRTTRSRRAWVLVAVASLALGLIAPTALADDGPDDGAPDDGSHDVLVPPDRSDSLVAHDAATADIVS